MCKNLNENIRGNCLDNTFDLLTNTIDDSIQIFSEGKKYWITYHVKCQDPSVSWIKGNLKLESADVCFKSKDATNDRSEIPYFWKKKDANSDGVIKFIEELTSEPKLDQYMIGVNYSKVKKKSGKICTSLNDYSVFIIKPANNNLK